MITWGFELSRYEHLNPVQIRSLGSGRGDGGRDLVLFLGRRQCGMNLKELAQAAVALQRFEQRLRRRKAGREQFKRVCETSNIEM